MAFDPASLTYDSQGLIPAIAQDHATGEVLMLAWMNAASLARTTPAFSEGRLRLWVAEPQPGPLWPEDHA